MHVERTEKYFKDEYCERAHFYHFFTFFSLDFSLSILIVFSLDILFVFSYSLKFRPLPPPRAAHYTALVNNTRITIDDTERIVGVGRM